MTTRTAGRIAPILDRFRGSGQILEHRLVGRLKAWSKGTPAEPAAVTHLGFMADDDGAQAVGRGAEREGALGVHPIRPR